MVSCLAFVASEAKVWMYLVCLDYWTLNVMPLMVYLK